MPFIDKQVIPWDLVLLRINCTWVFKIFQIALVASRLGQFWKILKTLVQLILNSTWPHVITYTNRQPDFYVFSVSVRVSWEKSLSTSNALVYTTFIVAAVYTYIRKDDRSLAWCWIASTVNFWLGCIALTSRKWKV